jgi:hypothetical protein
MRLLSWFQVTASLWAVVITIARRTKMTYNPHKSGIEMVWSNAELSTFRLRPKMARPRPNSHETYAHNNVAAADERPWFEVIAEQWFITFVASQP